MLDQWRAWRVQARHCSLTHAKSLRPNSDAKIFPLLYLCLFLACNSSLQGSAQTLDTTTATSQTPSTRKPPNLGTHPYNGPNPIVTTLLGPIEGLEVTPTSTRLSASSSVHSFRGIPYALPPIGARRFEPAELVSTPWTGTLSATQYGATCIQLRREKSDIQGPDQSEDCLFLNIWTPAGEHPSDSSAMGRSELLPVMVYVHGGGHTTGSASDRWYDGTNIAATSNVVVVTLNYRLGPLGFTSLSRSDVGGPSPKEARACNQPVLKRSKTLKPWDPRCQADSTFATPDTLLLRDAAAGATNGGSGGMNGYHDVLVALQWVQ
eukprot:9491826-Pyramimonas_sp.AAC.1